MNETRDLIIGIDFGKKYSQICYYDRKAEEARSLPVKVGSSLYETPTCLCRRTDTDQEEYCIGLEAEYFAREKGGFLLEDLYAVSMSREKVHVAGEDREPWEILGLFLRGMLKFPWIQSRWRIFRRQQNFWDFLRTSSVFWIMKRAFIIMCLPRRWKPGTEAWGGTASARIRLFFGSLL